MKYWVEELVEQYGEKTWTLLAKTDMLDIAKLLASVGRTRRRITTQQIAVVWETTSEESTSV